MRKLQAARARLVLDHPFIGALVLHLPLEQDDRCDTVVTDVRRLYFNPGYVGALSLAETQFVLAHTAMHCALGHFARRGHRLRQPWDVACDHVVNLLLLEEGLTAPAGALAQARFRGLSAEEVYPLIAPDTTERTLDRHPSETAGASGVGAHPAMREGMAAVMDERDAPGAGAESADRDAWSDAAVQARRNSSRVQFLAAEHAAELEALKQQWRMRLVGAAQQAQRAGRFAASWQRVLGDLIEPRIGWRALLARFLGGFARDDYSFQRGARREGAALLPRLHSGQLEVYAVLDTSGSIGDRELRAFTSELDALKGQVRARLTVHACDQALAAEGPWVFEPWQTVELPARLAGGGGTRFAPAFEWIATEALRPDVVLYFTDAEGEFPPSAPPYPVIWLVKGRASVPWGERIPLDA